MNTISWTLYLASVAGNVDIVLTISLLIYLMGICLLNLAKSMENNFKPSFPYFKVFLAVLVLDILVPCPNVIFAIAASEVVDKPKVSELSSKALKALDTWLEKQITN